VSAAEELKARIDTIEESYEFFLAYAAQGVSGEQATKSSGQVREFLQRSETAVPELADLFVKVVEEQQVDQPQFYRDFIDVLRRDAADALSAIRLVLAQRSISSQMVDNLNAMIHLRALLTDVFLIDEILSPRATGTATPQASP
jgi:uncharacterized protein YutE (UPF0331/DUF86 family)